MFESVQSALDPADRRVVRIGELAWAVALGGALVFAIAMLLAVFGVGIAFSHDAPSERLRIELTSRQSWWEIHYEPRSDQRIPASELRMPLRRPVELILSAGNGASSRLRVPALALDAAVHPGKPTRLLVTAMERGTFAALGASVAVVAEGTADFDEWLARQAVPSVTPTHPELREGRAAFFRASCDGCHTIRGTAARGIAGPDLTHVSTRPSMSADSLGTHLRSVPGARARRPAPGAHPQAELRAIAAYLASLK